jgi:hypothetical protein
MDRLSIHLADHGRADYRHRGINPAMAQSSMKFNSMAKVHTEGELSYENRTCEYKGTYVATRFDDCDPDPRYRICTPAKFNCFDIVDMTITVRDNNGAEIGKYIEEQIPRDEWSLWIKLIEKKIKAELNDNVNDFNWSKVNGD